MCDSPPCPQSRPNTAKQTGVHPWCRDGQKAGSSDILSYLISPSEAVLAAHWHLITGYLIISHLIISAPAGLAALVPGSLSHLSHVRVQGVQDFSWLLTRLGGACAVAGRFFT